MSLTNIAPSLQRSIDLAIDYLETSQWPGGFWIDFELYVGMSNQWVTAYVAHCLARARRTSPAITKAIAYLQRTELEAGGWGYHREVPPDGDSTANVVYLLARYHRKALERAEILRCAAILLSFQSVENGGFVTYRSRPAAHDGSQPAFMYQGSGWTIAHLSVTGLAVVALLATDRKAFRSQIEQGCKFIRKMQTSAGYWEDHWWQDRIYGTYWAARALTTNASSASENIPLAGDSQVNISGDHERARLAQRWLLQAIETDGGWGNGKGGTSSAFYTGLAISTLLLPAGIVCSPLSATERAHANTAVYQGLQWLVEAQLPDGSWPSVPMLLTPVPEVLVPWESDHPSSHQAVADQNRLFTTATVVATLARALDWLKGI